uniref:XtrA/YqaO family protein n=1 Tax=Bacillus sp. OTU530 TaxID=3043862 RepID=UPI00313B3DAA
MKRPEVIKINVEDMSIQQKLENGKVLVLILDGVKGTATKVEAPEHGLTVIETAKGKSARVKFECGYLI